jgi:hypothetical protein
MISAKASLADRLEGMSHFCNDYQTKPFEKNELLQRVASWIALRRLIVSSHQEFKTRAALVRTTPTNIIPAVLKDPSIVSKIENVITVVLYFEKIRALFETHMKEQMRFLQFMKMVAKYNEQLESFLTNKRQAFILESSGTQIVLHFTEFEDIMAGAKFITGLLNDLVSLGEKYTIVEKLSLDRLIRIGVSCGRGIGGVVNGRYAIATTCYIESLVLAEKSLPGHAHLSYLLKSAAGLQASQVAERGKFNGRATFILKKAASETLQDILIQEDLGPLAGAAGQEADTDDIQTGVDGRRTVGVQAEDDDKPAPVVSEEAEVPPLPVVEPPKKPPEPIVRRRGDMIREELRSRIERLMIESEVEAISGNALLRHQTLQALYGSR